MRALTLRIVVLVLVLGLIASAAEAQRRGRARQRVAAALASGPRIGGHLGYNFDVEELLLGAQFSYPITPRIDLYPTFDYYFVDPGSLWSLNFDLKFRPPTRYGAFYVGGGLNISRSSVAGTGNTDTGLNLLSGLEGRRRSMAPYVEAKLIVGDGSSFQVVGGLNFRMR